MPHRHLEQMIAFLVQVVSRAHGCVAVVLCGGVRGPVVLTAARVERPGLASTCGTLCKRQSLWHPLRRAFAAEARIVLIRGAMHVVMSLVGLLLQVLA